FNLKFGGDFRQIKNYTYFDTLSLPAQDTNLLTIKTLYLKKTFNFKPFVLDLNLYYQLVNNQDVLHIPQYSAYASFFTDFSLFKGALLINFGVDTYYYSKFNTYRYNPSLGMFYLANNRISGNYPIFNIFLSGKIKSATVIVRLDNAAGWLLNPYHETVEHYHISDFYIRFGVHWWFKN
ncbi:MAG: putative porin, partial [Bacteroidota bacterium]|nr:putative porin [Bacteroidota bacterium]